MDDASSANNGAEVEDADLEMEGGDLEEADDSEEDDAMTEHSAEEDNTQDAELIPVIIFPSYRHSRSFASCMYLTLC